MRSLAIVICPSVLVVLYVACGILATMQREEGRESKLEQIAQAKKGYHSP